MGVSGAHLCRNMPVTIPSDHADPSNQLQTFQIYHFNKPSGNPFTIQIDSLSRGFKFRVFTLFTAAADPRRLVAFAVFSTRSAFENQP